MRCLLERIPAILEVGGKRCADGGQGDGEEDLKECSTAYVKEVGGL